MGFAAIAVVAVLALVVVGGVVLVLMSSNKPPDRAARLAQIPPPGRRTRQQLSPCPRPRGLPRSGSGSTAEVLRSWQARGVPDTLPLLSALGS